ncbi:hypothetical protein VTH06DRAFT_2663 [Thermothelomyces fergusii]
MDIPLQWSLNYLKGRFLPPPPNPPFFPHPNQILEPISTAAGGGSLDHQANPILHPSSPVQTLRAWAPTLLAEMGSLLGAALDALAALVGSSPAIVGTAVAVVLAALVLQLLRLVRRLVLFWARLAFRMLFWSAVVLLAAAAWQRGLERTARDLLLAASRLVGWGAGATAGAIDLFWQEYEKAREANSRPRVQSQMHYQAWGYRMEGAVPEWP